MNLLLITDTHFGVKQNSITWLNSQMDYLEKQVIPLLKEHPDTIIIHMGDVFDSRSSISTYVARRVVDVFNKMRGLCQKFVIIGGNHDYYSPNQDSIETLSLLFDPVMFTLVTTKYMLDGDRLYVPWYVWLNEQDVLAEVVKHRRVRAIFTHADLEHGYVHPGLKYTTIFSGHIHIPNLGHDHHYTLGSCYAQSFADANQERGCFFWDLDNRAFPSFVPNQQSIRFWRLYNEQILESTPGTPRDYYELYISQDNLIKSEYTSRLQSFIAEHKNCWIIPQSDVSSDGLILEKYGGCDIESIIDDMIPEPLREYMQKVRERHSI